MSFLGVLNCFGVNLGRPFPPVCLAKDRSAAEPPAGDHEQPCQHNGRSAPGGRRRDTREDVGLHGSNLLLGAASAGLAVAAKDKPAYIVAIITRVAVGITASRAGVEVCLV
jgi:hypothetical protein